MSDKKDGPFMTGFKFGFKAVATAKNFVKKIHEVQNFEASLREASTLPKPDRTPIIHEIVEEWKKKPDHSWFAIVKAVDTMAEPSRRTELKGLLVFFVSRNNYPAVKMVKSLL